MLTRLGQSAAGPHRTGVFATVTLKRGQSIYAHEFSTLELSTLEGQLPPGDRSGAVKRQLRCLSTPCSVSFRALPKSRVSLMDFMMLRHAWSSDQSFLVEHPAGLFAVCPRTCVPTWMLRAAVDQAVAEGLRAPVYNAENRADGVAGTPSRHLAKHVDVIASTHYFHINDPFPWEFPPANDLANHEFWSRTFKPMWKAYASTVAEGSGTIVPNVAFGADSIGERPTDGQWTPLPTVHLLKDVDAGEELVALYGRAWWAQHFLSRLFVAAGDAELKHIRWIESMFTTDEGGKGSGPFPLLKVCRSRKTGRLDLANAVTRAPASSSAVLAAAVRKSCQDPAVLQEVVTSVFECPVSALDPSALTYPKVAPLTSHRITSLKRPLLHAIVGSVAESGDGPTIGNGGDKTADDGGMSL
jgi:hypothetical protein